MTITEIEKVLSTSFKNGFYIRRPFFSGYELYINKASEVWHVSSNGEVSKTELMSFEVDGKCKDWEIVQ